MKKRLKYIIIIILLLVIIAVFGLITGNVSHKLSVSNVPSNYGNWKIKFDDLSDVILGGTAKEITSPTINTYDTKINNYAVSLTSPGDNVIYKFNVVNEGSYNAIISNLFVAKPDCMGTGENAFNDAENVCNHLQYLLTYQDGTTVSIGDTLHSMETKNMMVKLIYDSNVSKTELIKNSVFIDNLDVSITYAQCGNECKVSE